MVNTFTNEVKKTKQKCIPVLVIYWQYLKSAKLFDLYLKTFLKSVNIILLTFQMGCVFNLTATLNLKYYKSTFIKKSKVFCGSPSFFAPY